jgi:hypothetical protein
MRRNLPPALACWLLQSVVPVSYREAILGDLTEEYTLRAESTSPLSASRWFWSQACRSVPSMAWSSLRNGDWLFSLSIAMGVYIVMGVLKFAADLTISKLVAPQQTTYVALAPIMFLTITAIGGCVAARIRRGATIFLALVVMITVVVLIELKICTIPVPRWYQFGFLTLGPLAVLFTPVIARVLRPGAVQPAK